ncbi:peptidoglycan DD-metalloendopeptidase family protein [Paenibacillus sp. CAU 1782]
MGLKDDIRERRRQKIQSLLDTFEEKPRQLTSGQDRNGGRSSGLKTGKPDTGLPLPRDNEPDPEVAWKQNRNPWSSWESNEHFGVPAWRDEENDRNNRDESSGSGGRFWSGLKWKTAVALLLFGGIWGLFQLEQEWSLKGQVLIKSALTDEFDFAAAAEWYKTAFSGAPSFIPLFQKESAQTASAGEDGGVFASAPVKDASLLRTFAELLNGIQLAAPSGAEVSAVDKGRVIFVTDKGDNILIQHAGNVITVYGELSQSFVTVNDWVEAGDIIGKLPEAGSSGSSPLYFAVKRNDRYIDPLDVIPLD